MDGIARAAGTATPMSKMTPDKNPPASAFHSIQLWLLLAGHIKPSEARAIVTESDRAFAAWRLEQALELGSNQISLTQQQAARTYFAALESGTASPARGSSRLDAIVVLSDNSEEGIALHYGWLEWRFGDRDVNWKMTSRGHNPVEGTVFDWFRLETSDGDEHYVEFDITSFYGHWSDSTSD